MSTQTVFESTPDTALPTESATELLAALGSVPTGHPSRAALRDLSLIHI